MKKKIRILIYPLMALGLVLILTNSCKKDDSSEPSNTVKDIDGNVYHTVTIGTQTWMAENLKTTKYRDGTAIPNVTDNIAWITQTTGACCWYNNIIANKTTYGALYNWYTVVDSRNLCPTGWHVPTNAEWGTLIFYMGGESVAGGKLKANRLWASPNTSATNSSGFTALPGGGRSYDSGSYNGIGFYGYWWSATEIDAAFPYPYFQWLYYNSSVTTRFGNYKREGFSVRCLRDL